MIGEQRFWGCDQPVTHLRSHTLSTSAEELYASTRRSTDELLWKLNAEHERLVRLLPDPPVGYRWEFVIYRSEDISSYSVRFYQEATLKENV